MRFLLFILIVLFITLFCGCKSIVYDEVYCSAYEPIMNYGYLKESDKKLYDVIKQNNIVYTRFCLNDYNSIKENKNN